MRGRYVSQIWAHDPSLYAPSKYRKGCRYDAFIPDLLAGFNPDIPAELAGTVADAESATRSLNDRARPALRPLARLLLRTESIASSKVEGLQADARSIARAEAKADRGDKVGSDVAEVLANIDAMELAVEETAALRQIAVEDLARIHGALMRRSPRASIAGQVRDVQNWIGGNDYNPCEADFVPPPPEELPALLGDLCSFCSSDQFPPLIQAAVAHAQFEIIHPFEDGNGRTGRALVHVLLRRRGLAPSYVPPISVVLAADKDRYVKGLTQYRDGDIFGWIERFAVSAARAAELAERYLARVQELQEHWRSQLRDSVDLRSDAAAWVVIDELPGHPVITVPVATALTGRSKSSTAVAFDQLVTAGILLPLSESKRNRAWEAAGLLEILADLEGAKGESR